MLERDILSTKQRFGIIGNSNKLNHAIQVAMQVAPTEMTVLITGESGSGKESFSKIIHQLSARKHNSFIAINCGAIPEGTIDSELFGHEKGAFTGASESRKGYFEVTDGGTIFLDEIGEMPQSTQARLLRVLENGEYLRVGSSKVHKTNVRVIAATNVNLIQAVEKGKFREDLYYRLNTVPIYVPPLRERGSDIYLLFRKFASDFSEKYRTKPLELSDDAKRIFESYAFPGNIRQLRNLVDQMSVLETDRRIDSETIVKYLPEKSKSSTLPALYTEDKGSLSEREILYKVLFDMKRDMTELKQVVFEAVQKGSLGAEVLDHHRDLFENMEQDTKSLPPAPEQSNYQVIVEPQVEISTDQFPDSESREVVDIAHEYEEESLSLEGKEKELIIKALQKNKNKRKYAALDLGISERTLYRKIKQYNINA